MMKAYRPMNGRLSLLGPEDDLTQAVWIDLFTPEGVYWMPIAQASC